MSATIHRPLSKQLTATEAKAKILALLDEVAAGGVLVDRDAEWIKMRSHARGLERKTRAYRREMSRRAREAFSLGAVS